MKGSVKLIAALVILAAIAGGLWAYWRHTSLYPSTEDAYVGAHVISIASEVSGTVTAVHVVDNQRVKAGDLLFEIDNRTYADTVKQAEAALKNAQDATISLAQQVEAAQKAVDSAASASETARAQLTRVQGLFDRGDAAQSSLDQARSSLAQAQAAVGAAQAQLSQARAAQTSNSNAIASAEAQLNTDNLNLERTRVTAPVDGWVANLTLRTGSSVVAYSPLFAMVDLGEWWVDANFKETDLPRIKPGQPVKIEVDMLPGVELTGKVGSIAPGSGSTFALLPAENASGNWVKVTQRFAVRIPLDPTDAVLRVGASAVAKVDTTQSGTPE